MASSTGFSVRWTTAVGVNFFTCQRSATFGGQKNWCAAPLGAPCPGRFPRALRGLFERERELLGILSRCTFEAGKRVYPEMVGRRDAVPGHVGSILTPGGQAIVQGEDRIYNHPANVG